MAPRGTRRLVAATVIVAGLAIAVVSVAAGGRSEPSRATSAQLRAFLALAKRGSQGSFTLTYDIGVRYSHGRVRHLSVIAAQSSPARLFYRETPSLELWRTGGPPRSHGFELFYLAATASEPGQLFSCVQLHAHWPWRCQGPIRGIGMGGMNELFGPYPPQALLLGLGNAVESAAGEPAPPAIRPEPIFLTTLRQSGRDLHCIQFGRLDHPLGHVCLMASGIVASYDVSPAVTYGAYYTATLRRYSPGGAGVTLPTVVRLGDVTDGPGAAFLIHNGHLSSGEFAGIYTLDRAHRLRRAGEFTYGGDSAQRYGFTCRPGPPPTIVQHQFLLEQGPISTGRWRQTDITYTWFGSTLRRTGSITEQHVGAPPPNLVGIDC